METTIQKWGNSLAVRLPKDMARNLNLREGSRVAVREQKKEIVVSPAAKARLTFQERLALITPENMQEEIDWGKPRDKEVW